MHVEYRGLERLLALVPCAVLVACRGDGAAPPMPAAPELLMAHAPHVARVRDSLRRGEPQFAEALGALERDAGRALTTPTVSVMDKGAIPPSGDKHDYMSQAPYWWPDPSRPDGQPYVERDGERNPEIERIPDRENLERVSRAVSALALAYHLTGREEYADQAARFVRVWFLDAATRMNPHLEFAQGIPGITEGRSAGIIESRFLPTIIDGVVLLHGSPAWTASDDHTFRRWMRAYLEWLLTSQKGRAQANRGNNQETWYRLQVVALALYTGERQAARTTLLDAQFGIGGQFERDGRQPRELMRTRAWDYGIFNLTAYMHLAALGQRLDVDLWSYSTDTGRSLRQGIEYLVPFATGEERFPYQQITEFRPSAFHPVLRWAALGWNEPRYRDLARQIGGGAEILDLTLP